MWNYIKKILASILIIFQFSFVAHAYTFTYGIITDGSSFVGLSSDSITLTSTSSNTPANGILKTGKTRMWINSAGSVPAKMVVYSDSPGPDTLLAQSDEVSVTNTTEQEVSFTFSGNNQINITANTKYWIGVHFDYTSISLRFDQDSCTQTRYIQADDYSDGTVTTITSPSTATNTCFRSYIEYTEDLGATYISEDSTIYRSGLRLDFDGVDEAGKSGDNPTGNTDTVGSLACWVTFDDTLASNKINIFFGMGGDDTDQATNFGQLSLGRRYASGIDNKLEILYRVDNSATVNRVRGGTTLSAGTYFLGITSNGTTWNLYVNGVAETLTTVAGSNTGDWFGDIGTVGTRHYSVGNSWRDGAWGTSWVNGKIDNCFTTSNELTSSQILSLYNNGKPIHPCAIITCSNVNVFYKLGEDANGTVTTMHAAIGNPSIDNFTMENMEDADIVTTSYY